MSVLEAVELPVSHFMFDLEHVLLPRKARRLKEIVALMKVLVSNTDTTGSDDMVDNGNICVFIKHLVCVSITPVRFITYTI